MLAILAPLASLLGIETEALLERFRRQALLWSTVGILLAIGFVFLLIAANAALALSFGPVVAPLILAGSALLLALVIYLIALIVASMAKRREAERQRSAETTALVTTAAVAALPMLMKSPLFRKLAIPAGGVLAAAYLLTRPSHHDDSKEP
jgi:hypothetical protein